MKFILTMFCISFSLQATFAADNISQSPAKRLLFLHFYNAGQEERLQWLETTVIEAMHMNIRNKYRYQRIDEQEWRAYFEKNGYTAKDLGDKDKISRMGHALKADGVIFGKIHLNQSTQEAEVVGKILSVVDEEIIGEKLSSVKLDANMFQATDTMSAALAEKIKDLFIPSDLGALWRSALIPSWGQYYKQRHQAAYIWAGTVGAAGGFLLYSSINYFARSASYRNYSAGDGNFSQNEYDSRFASYESSAKLLNISLVIFAVVYAANIFDAWFFEGYYDIAPVKSAAAPGNAANPLRAQAVGGAEWQLAFTKAF